MTLKSGFLQGWFCLAAFPHRGRPRGRIVLTVRWRSSQSHCLSVETFFVSFILESLQWVRFFDKTKEERVAHGGWAYLWPRSLHIAQVGSWGTAMWVSEHECIPPAALCSGAWTPWVHPSSNSSLNAVSSSSQPLEPRSGEFLHPATQETSGWLHGNKQRQQIAFIWTWFMWCAWKCHVLGWHLMWRCLLLWPIPCTLVAALGCVWWGCSLLPAQCNELRTQCFPGAGWTKVTIKKEVLWCWRNDFIGIGEIPWLTPQEFSLVGTK